MKVPNERIAAFFLQGGLAFVLFYAAISSLYEPDAWISYIPSFTTVIFPASTSLMMISFFQIALAIWLLSGLYVRYAALVTAALIAGLVVFNLNSLIITFRDIGLVLAAVALFTLTIDDPRKTTHS
jgi:hypothetical protein